MEAIINFVLSFFKRKDGKNSYWGLIFIVATLLFVNYLFSFSDQYKFEKKIDNLKSIESLLKDKTLDKNVANYLIKKKEDIISEIKFDPNHIYKIPQKEVTNFLDFRKFPVIHYISSSWLFIFLTILLPIRLFDRSSIVRGTLFTTRLLTIIVMTFTVYCASIIYSSLLENIPIISYKHLWINYLLNFFSIFFTILFFYFLYSLFNVHKNYSQFMTENDMPYDPNDFSPLAEKIGEDNPLLWAHEIIKYNYSNNDKRTTIIFTILTITLFFFAFGSIIYTLYSIVRYFIEI